MIRSIISICIHIITPIAAFLDSYLNFPISITSSIFIYLNNPLYLISSLQVSQNKLRMLDFKFFCWWGGAKLILEAFGKYNFFKLTLNDLKWPEITPLVKSLYNILFMSKLRVYVQKIASICPFSKISWNDLVLTFILPLAASIYIKGSFFTCNDIHYNVITASYQYFWIQRTFFKVGKFSILFEHSFLLVIFYHIT